MDNKKEIIQVILAGILSLSLMAGAYFLVTYKPTVKMNEVEDLGLTSDLASTDPRETTSRVIRVNGTMGNIEKDITQDSMKTHEATYQNGNRRLVSLARVKKVIVPGSPLINGKEESNAKSYADTLMSPYLYEVSNIKVSEPSNPGKLVVYSETGPVEYESIEVLASFDSKKTSYDCARDTSYDGTHTQIDNIESYENIKVVLVKSGELWFIYDIEDSEYIINERFATWSGISTPTVNFDKDEEVGIFRVKGIDPPIIPIDENAEYEENNEVEEGQNE